MNADFFQYYCDGCGEQFCERVNIMNLALGFVDDAFCLTCLAKDHDRGKPAMAEFCWGYVQARDCFKDPWMKFDASGCPKIETGTCHCQHPKN